VRDGSLDVAAEADAASTRSSLLGDPVNNLQSNCGRSLSDLVATGFEALLPQRNLLPFRSDRNLNLFSIWPNSIEAWAVLNKLVASYGWLATSEIGPLARSDVETPDKPER
tara:strand:- start:26 stop:358 length:333 start_codon:yes stop_codon:yes gene_type:complete